MYNYIAQWMNDAVVSAATLQTRGRVTRVQGMIVEASVPEAKIGDLYALRNPTDQTICWAEVVGLIKERVLLTPLSDMRSISVNTEVIPSGRSDEILVGDALLGRVIDGMGEPIDGKGKLALEERYAIHNEPPDLLLRQPISKALPLGVSSIDGLITCGEGQRVGIFAAAGVGKSTLLSMIARHAHVDIIVVVLIGERGREVREFIDHQLGEEGLKRAVLVVATADKPAMQRARAAYIGTAIAEYFRDKGKKVLLLMDSVTRLARALREIGLAAGEAPTRRGYPPSAFSVLPKLMERAGQGQQGSITALYTVLVEGDDMNEPVSDEMRATLDGHIVLSRDLAAANHYPAVDVLQSLSRIMNYVVSTEHMEIAGKVRATLSKYKEIEFLVRMGEYREGSDEEGDYALAKIDGINKALCQSLTDNITIHDTLNALKSALDQ